MKPEGRRFGPTGQELLRFRRQTNPSTNINFLRSEGGAVHMHGYKEVLGIWASPECVTCVTCEMWQI